MTDPIFKGAEDLARLKAQMGIADPPTESPRVSPFAAPPVAEKEGAAEADFLPEEPIPVKAPTPAKEAPTENADPAPDTTPVVIPVAVPNPAFAEVPKPVEEVQPVEQAAAEEQEIPAKEAATEDADPAPDTTPVVIPVAVPNPAFAEMPKSVEEVQPVEESTSAEKSTPVEEPIPAKEELPVKEAIPVKESPTEDADPAPDTTPVVTPVAEAIPLAGSQLDDVSAAWDTVAPQPVRTTQIRREAPAYTTSYAAPHHVEPTMQASAEENAFDEPEYVAMTFDDLYNSGAYRNLTPPKAPTPPTVPPTPAEEPVMQQPTDYSEFGQNWRSWQTPQAQPVTEDIPPMIPNIPEPSLPSEQPLDTPVTASKKHSFLKWGKADGAGRSPKPKKPKKPSPPPFEFTDSMQSAMVRASYRRQFELARFRVIFCAVIAILAFLFENISPLVSLLPAAFRFDMHPVYATLIDDLLVLVAMLIVGTDFLYGAKALRNRRIEPESFLCLLSSVTVLYQLVLGLMGKAHQIQLMGLPLILSALIIALARFYTVKSDAYAFSVVSSREIKTVVAAPDAEGSASAYRTGFVDRFFEARRMPMQSRTILRVMLAFSSLIAVIYFLLMLFSSKEVYAALRVAYASLAMTMPVSMSLLYILPFWRLSNKAFYTDCALMGEATVDAMAGAKEIELADRTVFAPASIVKVRVHGSNRMDTVLQDFACAMDAVGGPLAECLYRCVYELGYSQVHRLVEATANGLEVIIEGNKVVQIGNADYLRSKHYPMVHISSEEEAVRRGDYSVAYVAINGEVALTCYIAYNLRPEFEAKKDELFATGADLKIRTADPLLTMPRLRKLFGDIPNAVSLHHVDSLEACVAYRDRMGAELVYAPEDPNALPKPGEPAELESPGTRDIVQGELKLLELFCRTRTLKKQIRTGVTVQTFLTVATMMGITFFLKTFLTGMLPSFVAALFQLAACVPPFLFGIGKEK